MSEGEPRFDAEAMRAKAKEQRAGQAPKMNGHARVIRPGALRPIDSPKTYDEMREAHPRRPSLIKGLIQRGSIYALTGFTGHAKTTVSLYIAMMVSEGGFVGSALHEVMHRGTVVFLAGENPANVADQWLATCRSNGVDPSKVRIRFIDRRFDVHKQMAELLEILAEIDDLALVVVDTLQAFFMGEDDNSNQAMAQFASEWRQVCNLETMPTVLIPCHPAGKKAADTKDNLVPRGASALLGEIDANLSVYRDGEEVTLHWAGKFRGQYPDPVRFELEDQEFDEIADEDGSPMPMAVLKVTTEGTRSSKWGKRQANMERVLFRLDQKLSIARRTLVDVLMVSEREARAIIEEMLHKKLIKSNEIGRGYVITNLGQKELKRLREEAEAEIVQ